MIVAGIVIILVSILLIFLKFFLNLKSADTVFVRMKKINNNLKIIMCVRIWGICLIVGVVLIIKSF